MNHLKKYNKFLIQERLTFKKRDVISDIGGYDSDVEDAHQSIMNLGYNEWPQHNDWSYADMLSWVEDKYGELARFAIQFGKYNQQVGNGGHLQYYSNGYASGGGGGFDNHEGDISYHEELLDFLEKADLEDYDWYSELYSIMAKFEIEIDEERHEEGTCEECAGDGSRDCEECDGGAVDCEECDGSGEIEGDDGDTDDCGDCGGDGHTGCTECDGGGESECYECEGTGQFEYENEEYGTVINPDLLDILDDRYYKIHNKIMDDFEKYFKKKLELA